MDWSNNRKLFYHIDTFTNKMMKHDYDLETAKLSNDCVAVEITDSSSPDEICVDIDENIWVAEYGGKRIYKWDSKTGEHK